MSQDAPSGIRRAELIGALSLAIDFATGEPLERSMRSCIVATRLGTKLGLPPEALTDVYYVSLLRWVGCTADAHVAAQVFGDERAVSAWIRPVLGDGPLAVMAAMLRYHAKSEPLPQRAIDLLQAFAGMPKVMSGMKAHCEVAQELARRMGFGAGVLQGLGLAFETWNGHGPNKVKGEKVPLSVRLALLGADMQLFQSMGGVESAVEVARRRSGKAYEPALTSVFCDHAAELLEGLDGSVSWSTVLDLEPEPRQVLTNAELDEALAAIAGFVDLKSPFLSGHSTAVADLAAAAAQHCRLSPAEVTAVRRAGLVHEIGLAGISAGILGKTGLLTETEAERLRLHTYYAERVLAKPESLAELGAIAAMHHERLDGSGYHRGVPAGSQPLLARILAAACVYHTELSEQPGRMARAPEHAARLLQEEATAGRLDQQATTAVLAAAGQVVQVPRQSYPAGLSEREVDVLRLLSRGLSRKEIAGRLVIADKTVARHIEHIYEKTGLNTRPAATLFAMQHGLLG